ncbi:transcription initiation factor TFIIA large subunit [Cladophialophora carrionii]|uniref:Transcription initiation factor TFIIA large subunit n=1 Tax=Cladophialophora carrionii TaxID=86049 RepID=A0A1C1CMX5_9EURO|nr:transcription initiation factor TFIIA large subunit [Cladophialophora carrionii]
MQGDVYAKVINDVCEASRQDFEEGGVELATLDLLKSPLERWVGDGGWASAAGEAGIGRFLNAAPALSHGLFLYATTSMATPQISALTHEWQKKLTALKVAQLPWDPPPAPAIKEQATVPSNVKAAPQTLPSNGAGVSTPPMSQPSASSVVIKNEPNAAPSYSTQQAPPQAQQYQAPSFQQGQPLTARDRAAMNLHQQYGPRAGVQIAQLQSGGQPRVSMPPAAPSSSYIKQEESSTGFDGVQDYSPSLQLQPRAVDTSQTDGSGDARDAWSTEFAQRKALAAAHSMEGDNLMRAHFQARQQSLEGGGLLTPLDERLIPDKSTTRKVNALGSAGGDASKAVTPSLARSQGDATGDDDEEDEDAINSDLDDPDDLAAAEENGENTDQVMLCTYDKVQRVKNKWKCTLKDGVLRVDGTE